jgi:hypothetical protein
MRRATLVAIGCLTLAAAAGAHGPETAIGRAVEAFDSVSVSWDPGAAVSEVEAGGFPGVVGSNPKVAFLPASASGEQAGGPDAIAEEIAREAGLHGTLVVLVGSELGIWSDGISASRLRELVSEAQTGYRGVTPAGAVESLVRAVQQEPTPAGPPWGWLALAFGGLAAAVLVAADRRARRRSSASR